MRSKKKYNIVSNILLLLGGMMSIPVPVLTYFVISYFYVTEPDFVSSNKYTIFQIGIGDSIFPRKIILLILLMHIVLLGIGICIVAMIRFKRNERKFTFLPFIFSLSQLGILFIATKEVRDSYIPGGLLFCTVDGPRGIGFTLVIASVIFTIVSVMISLIGTKDTDIIKRHILNV